MTPVTSEQSAEVHRLNAEGLSRTAISEKLGVGRRQVDSVLAWIKIRGQRGETTDEKEISDAIGTTFSLERDLQSALRQRICQLEPGMTIIDGNKEQIVPSGRIDITARDRNGIAVVIELKAGEADRDAISQLLSYMGDKLTVENAVRGILVAGDFTLRAIAAARAAQNIEPQRYDISFSFARIVPPV